MELGPLRISQMHFSKQKNKCGRVKSFEGTSRVQHLTTKVHQLSKRVPQLTQQKEALSKKHLPQRDRL